MPLLSQLLEALPDGEVVQVRIGLHWTAVVVDVAGEQRCGLCSTLFSGHHHGRRPPAVPEAGELTRFSGRALAMRALDSSPTMTSVAIAAMNALIPQQPDAWVESNAEDVIAQRGRDRRVVMVGHFPFVERLRPQVGELIVLEQDPGPSDLAAEQAPQVIPQAQVVAITGMTLSNHTLGGLLALCSPQAFVILMGPSTPLDPLLFDYGVDVLSGAVVTNIQSVLEVVSQAGNFRQVHRAGVRLVNLIKPNVSLS
jgi:uncharacterized protein (DUF4213/DUF364 family)